jgi:hypothetical protein
MMQQLEKNWPESSEEKKRKNYKGYWKPCYLVLGVAISEKQNALFYIS